MASKIAAIKAAGFKGAAKRIEDTDLPRIGHRIGVGEDEIHAVMDVEAAGTGFDNKGRPRMLFEPHIFYRELKDRSQRDRAVKARLAYPKWRRNYPKDSYPRLLRAMEINPIAALRSSSWGLGQLMGFNHRLAGYDSVVDMVADFMEDEDNHLEAMIAFIVNAGLDDELRTHNWAGFARGYNGPGFAKNAYDVKLRKAYGKWLRIPDTVWEPSETTPIGDRPKRRAGMLRLGMKSDQVSAWQQLLVDMGYAVTVDGRFGPGTQSATYKFQRDHQLSQDGLVGPETFAKAAEIKARIKSRRATEKAAKEAAQRPQETQPKPAESQTKHSGPTHLIALLFGLVAGWLTYAWETVSTFFSNLFGG